MAKVIFLHLSVIHSVHRGGVCLSACWDTTPPGSRPPTPPEQNPLRAEPPGADTPREQTSNPLGADTPLPGADPPGTDTPRADTPQEQTPTPQEQTPFHEHTPPGSRLQHTVYWNAFLLTPTRKSHQRNGDWRWLFQVGHCENKNRRCLPCKVYSYRLHA